MTGTGLERGSKWQQVVGGVEWTVVRRWSNAGSFVWVSLKSSGGAYRKVLSSDLQRDWLRV